jgi:PKD repeat protein
LVDFNADGPPNTCSGTETAFQNLTTTPDNNLIPNWEWNFDDPYDVSSGFEEHPQHIFKDPGTYSITLTATSEFGCTAEKTKEVVIHESPSAVFHHSTTCDDLPVTFSTSPGQTIAHFYWEIGSSYYYDPSPTHTFKSPGDFPVYLEVIGTNGCIAETNTNIHVPVPLTPDFSVIKNCVDQQAVFTDITSGLDPVATRSWNFNPGGYFTGQEVGVTFQKEGEISATLRVTAESGCSYETTRPVVVLAAPHASFEATPTEGGYPLEVQFLNTSSDATHYLWSFQNETSSDVSPIHTFREAGEFDVTLTAFNEQECEHTFTSVITAVPPLPDADIDLITLSPNDDGTYRLIVTIHNKGNTFLRDVPVDIDFGGSLQLREVVQETIAPSSKYNLVLGTGILHPDILEYLCVSMEVSNDRNSSGNRKCLRLDNDLFVFNIFPNPAIGQLTVEWISHASHTLRVSIVDALGREMLTSRTASAIGLNRQILDVSTMESGIYYLLFEDGATRHRQRIVVSNNR